MAREAQGGGIGTEEEAIKGGMTAVELWLQKVDLARQEEKDWREAAQRAVDMYEGNGDRRQYFSILMSNIETSVPALYNSTPVPDARRRYNEDDAVARTVGDIIERSSTYSIDRYDFDDEIRECVRDGELVGRGVARVRYEPDVTEDAIIDQVVKAEWVMWNRWGRGPGRRWDVIPFIYFDHDLSKEEVSEMLTQDLQSKAMEAKQRGEDFDPEAEVQKRLEMLGFGPDGFVQNNSSGSKSEKEKGVLQTIPVIEIWDKKSRKVLFITPRDKQLALRVIDDPLNLSNFFPVPRPLQRLRRRSSLAPIVPLEHFRELVTELDDVSKRIRKLISELRVRGIVHPRLAKDMDRISQLDDGQFLVADDGATDQLAEGGQNISIDDMIHHMPLNEIVAAVKELSARVEVLKQQIFEITGISDILRGATNPNETLGAQQIKATWGSQRVQMAQGDVQRFCRDIFRMKSEIIARHFEWPRIKQMTGINFDVPQPPDPSDPQFAPQPQPVDPQTGQPMPGQQQMGANGGPPLDPYAEAMAQYEKQVQQIRQMEQAVEEALRSDIMQFRIDIETDSTVKGDMAKIAENMNNFLMGTGQFAQAMAAIAPIIPSMVPAMTQIYAAFARNFRLGRQVEEILDKLMEQITQPGAIKTGEESADPEAAQQEADLQAGLIDKEKQAQIEVEQAKGQNIQLKNQGEIVKAQSAQAMAQAEMEQTDHTNRWDVEKMKIEASLPPRMSGGKVGMNGGGAY